MQLRCKRKIYKEKYRMFARDSQMLHYKRHFVISVIAINTFYSIVFIVLDNQPLAFVHDPNSCTWSNLVHLHGQNSKSILKRVLDGTLKCFASTVYLRFMFTQKSCITSTRVIFLRIPNKSWNLPYLQGFVKFTWLHFHDFDTLADIAENGCMRKKNWYTVFSIDDLILL